MIDSQNVPSWSMLVKCHDHDDWNYSHDMPRQLAQNLGWRCYDGFTERLLWKFYVINNIFNDKIFSSKVIVR